MERPIDILAALAVEDDTIRDAERKRASARARVPNAQAKADKAQATLDAADKALADHAQQEHATERKVEEYQTHLSRAIRALETGAGDADAAERQRVNCLAILDDLETQQLEQMDEREVLEANVVGAKERVAEAQQAVGEAAAACAPAVKEQTARLMAAKGQAIHLRAQLHAEELARYDALLKRNRRPVSPLVRDTCKACNRVQVARAIQELKRGRLVQCAGCGRWLHAPDLVIDEI